MDGTAHEFAILTGGAEAAGRLPESFPCGSPDLLWLRAGRYGVFSTIDEELGGIVQIDHVARLP